MHQDSDSTPAATAAVVAGLLIAQQVAARVLGHAAAAHEWLAV
jgi:hypothetical protein